MKLNKQIMPFSRTLSFFKALYVLFNILKTAFNQYNFHKQNSETLKNKKYLIIKLETLKKGFTRNLKWLYGWK